MDLNLIYLSLGIVVVACIVGLIVKIVKKGNFKLKDLNSQEFLKDFVSTVIEIANSSIQILMKNRADYKSERDFAHALAVIVAKELNSQLLKSDVSEIAKLIPLEEYIKFVEWVFSMYDKDINVSKHYNAEKAIPEKEVSEKVEKVEPPKGTTDIGEDIFNITRG